jgi:Ras family protein T1
LVLAKYQLTNRQTCLLRNFLQKSFSSGYAPTTTPYNVVNSVEADGAEKYLVLKEVSPMFDRDTLVNGSKFQSACDVACFLYDSSDPCSFEYVANLRVDGINRQKSFDFDGIPTIFIATKRDLDLVQQVVSG